MTDPRAARGYAAIGLHRPKFSLNVGSVIRAAHVYGAALVVTSGQRYTRAQTDVSKGYRHIPLQHADDLHAAIPFDCVPVAIDLIDGAKPLHSYTHPERAFYILGPEDGTLGRAVTAWCRDVVYVATPGHCMNLAAAANVVLYDRLAKRLRTLERMENP